MKTIFTIVRPEKTFDVTNALGEKGYYGFTKWATSGRGKQNGIQVGDAVYEEMAKSMVMVVVDDEDKDEVIDIIMEAALTGENGNSGDGKVFVLPVEESYTISAQIKD